VNRLVRVAVREYLENVRTKAFLIAVLLTPGVMGLSWLIPALTAKAAPDQRKLAVADVSGELGDALAKRLADRRMPEDKEAPRYEVERVDLGGPGPAEREKKLTEIRADLDERVKDGALFAYVVVRPSAIERKDKDDARPTEYRTGNLFDFKVQEDVRADLRDIVHERVIAASGIPKEAAALLTRPLPFATESVMAEGKAGTVAVTLMPFVFTLLLFVTIVSVSQMLITSTLEEKSTRVVEVLLSSVSPYQLMAGKIFGTCAVGLTLMAIWASAGLTGLALNGIHLLEPGQLLLCLAYYLLGFLLIASLMVAVGSACNTLKEAQNLLSPVMVILTLPLLFWLAVSRNPQGTLATVLSMIPLFTPFLMMMRVASTPPPPPIEIAASLVILGLAAWLAMRLAARVFRVGVLMYGKPPSLKELWRWVRVDG
jgi:ABC-2 type transport system permease protein